MEDPSQRYRWMLLAASLVTLGYLTAAALEESYLAEWRTLQQEYRVILQKKASDELGRALARNFSLELKQVGLPQLNLVDRCTTCHTGIDDPRMTDVRQPFAVHPGRLLQIHPADRFGCTVCHEGQGAATTYRDAAHEELEFWDRPMWKGEYLQAGCGKCHKEPHLPEAPALSAARTLYTQEFACDSCHRINEIGGRDCPDLTHIGSQALRALDFTHVKGSRTRQQWLYEHFKDPQAVIPDSAMPNQDINDEQARALTVLMLSLTDDQIPWDYVFPPVPRRPELVTGKADESQLFQDKGCLLCHALRGQGAGLGPDLAKLTGQRNADWLFQHFKNPRRAAPGSTIAPVQLTDAEANQLTRYVLSLP